MALGNDALTLVATAKAYSSLINAKSDAEVERLIEVASATIAEACERGLSLATVTERQPGADFLPSLALNRPPIVGDESTITVLDELNGEALTDFVVGNASAGLLERDSGWPARRLGTIGAGLHQVGDRPRYKVTYSGGYVTPTMGGTRTLPYQLEEACLVTMAYWLAQPAERQGVASVAALSASQSYTADSTGKAALLPHRAQQLLAPFRRQIGVMAVAS